MPRCLPSLKSARLRPGLIQDAGMGRRKPLPGQCAEVRRLAASGLSIRSIAAQVFGDARLRGRVERILNRPADAAEEPEAVRAREAELTEFGCLDRVAQVRWLLDRRLADWAARDGGPSGRELLALLKAEGQLRSFEEFDRLQAARRSQPGGELQ